MTRGESHYGVTLPSNSEHIMNLLSAIVRILKSLLTGKENPTTKEVAKGLLNVSYLFIFWGWNCLFLLVVYLGFLPFIGVPLVVSLATGEIPFPFVIPLLAFLIVPVACVVVGITQLRKHPASLIRLFYGVEAPVMALAILRLFILRELTPASTVVIAGGAISISTVAVELFFGYAAYSKWSARWQMAAHTVALTAGLYTGSVLLFYTVPILWDWTVGFVRLEWISSIIRQVSWIWGSFTPQGFFDFIVYFFESLYHFGLLLIALLLFGASAALFIGMPYALVVIFTRSWGRIRHAFSQQFDRRQAHLISGGVVATLGLLFFLTYPQPQTQALELLKQAPDSAAARQALVQKSPQIRKGLLNAYLMRYRYLGTQKDVNNLELWYPNVFPLNAEQSRFFQWIHNGLISPFLYQGDRADPDKAADLYAQFFDSPIQKAESDAIQQALESTVQRESVEASLLNITDRVVALARQEVTVKPSGDWAEVTLYERYENFTQEDQEIVYQFSLPESAVFTGLWLAEPGVAERYPFVVSPRGAAQQVYKQEIERAEWTFAEDPALLEQVGPRQYRLRVFPIPQRQSRFSPGITHLWMTYQVAQQEGAWPLPQLTEKRNLYWTKRTERFRSGQKLKVSGDVWYEEAIAASAKVAPQPYTATLAEGYTVTATPMANTTTAELAGKRLAVLMDASRSMGDRQAELNSALNTFKKVAQKNTVDWFITSETGMPAQKTSKSPEVNTLSFYGSLSLVEQLEQLEALRGQTEYDAIFVLTDAGNYELEDNDADIPSLSGSLWLIHLKGEVPTAYADQLQQHISDSKGGVTTSPTEALDRFAVEQTLDGTVMDGYQWEIADSRAPVTASSAVDRESAFQSVAARQAIRWLSRSRDMTQLEELDGLHEIAKRTEIVTPYSSMLVLVNDRQREALKEAENSGDRFAREIESGEDVLTNPGSPITQQVPENMTPITAVLIAVLLIWGKRRYRRRSVGQ